MRIYRWLLRLCPPTLRHEYGAAMEETFARRMSDAQSGGRWRRVRVLSRELIGVIVLAITERFSAATREQRRRHRMQSGPKAGRMDGVAQEVRYACRRLQRSPAFTAAAVLTLALAIGANAAIFAVVQRVVLNPLPYPDSQQLIELDHGAQTLNVISGLEMTSGLYFQYADRSRTLESVAIYRIDEVTLTGSGDAERLRVSRVSPSLASVLQVSPALGRWFSEDDALPGARQVAVLSHGLWARRFGHDPNVLGRTVILTGVPTEVIGVMPPSYAFPNPQVEAWIPAQITRAMGYGLWDYSGVARVRHGATFADVRAELNSLINDLPNAYPNDVRAVGNVQTKLFFVGRWLKEAMVGSVARALWILLASVGLVLLVACANVANLFLVRSEARQREVAVRRALGAGRFTIARYFLTESLLLSIAGGALGLSLAWGAVRLVVTFGPPTLPRLHEIQLDAVTLAFTFALSLLAACTFGAIPLLRGRELAASLHESGRSNSASRGRHRMRHLLMGAQVAVAVVLLVASGLMIRSFQKLRAVDPGFDASSTLTFNLGFPDREYRSRDSLVAAHHAIIDRLSSLPGTTAVSASTCLPLMGGCSGNTLRVEGRVYPPGTLPQIALFRAVAGGYFETMGIRLLRGRTIDRGDIERQELNVVISEALAKRFFPNEDPIGRRVASNKPPAAPGTLPDLTWLTIVGVVADTPTGRSLPSSNPQPQMYMPMSIASGPETPKTALVGPDISVMSYAVRTAIPPLDLVASVRQAITAIDANLALAQVRTLQDILDRASAQMAFTMVLLGIAASVALVLGMIGIYGVMSYIVSQRTGEIGVRLALGAEPARVSGAIVQQGAVVTSAGIAIGVLIAFAGGRFIESLLYGVSPRDPAVFVATTLTLLVIALGACWLPARRAARLSPVEALRTD